MATDKFRPPSHRLADFAPFNRGKLLVNQRRPIFWTLRDYLGRKLGAALLWDAVPQPRLKQARRRTIVLHAHQAEHRYAVGL